MYLNFFLAGDWCAGDSDRFRVPLSVYVDPDESSPTKDGRNAAAGGKRGRPKKQEAGAIGEDQRAEGAKRQLRENANLVQVRRQAVADEDDVQ